MGGRGAGSGIRRTAKSYKNIASLRDYAEKDLHIELDKSLDNMDFTLVRSAVESVEWMAKEFPKWVGRVEEIKAGRLSNAIAQTNGIVVSLSENYYSNRWVLDDAAALRGFDGMNPKNTNAESIVVHELGHTLERAICARYYSENRAAQIIEWDRNTFAKRIVSDAAKAAKKTPEGKGKKNSELISEVSRYATHNRAETLAECVADYYLNRKNAAPLSKAVWAVLKKELG